MSAVTTGGITPAAAVTRIGDTKLDKAFGIVNYVLLTVFTLSVLYPLIFVVSASISDPQALAKGEVVLWPVGTNVDAYRTILDSKRLVIGFRNSVFYTIVGALIGTAMTMVAGFVLARPDLAFRRSLMFFFLIPTMVSAGIIPTYMVVRSLGLLDTVWAVLLPGAMSVFNLIITRTFYQMNVPHEMLEASRVDGADDFQFFFRVALPLSKPIIAVNMLFYGVGNWNAWFSAFLYLNNVDLYPLQLVLREILTQSLVDPTQMSQMDLTEIQRNKDLFDKLKYALIVVAMVPPLIAYPFVQKHFIKGALIGSLK